MAVLYSASASAAKIFKHSALTSTVVDSFSVSAITTQIRGIFRVDRSPTGDTLFMDDQAAKVIRLSGFTNTIVTSFASPDSSPFGITQDGSGNLVTSGGLSDKYWKHSGITSTIIDSFLSPTGSPWGAAFLNGDLVSGEFLGDKFRRHSGFSSSITDSFLAPATLPSGIDFDGDGNLISADFSAAKIYIHSGFTSTITTSFAAPGGQTGGVYVEFALAPEVNVSETVTIVEDANLALTPTFLSAPSWFDPAWKFRQRITIDGAKVGGTLTDFPVFVDLSQMTSPFFSNVKSDGSDIVVTAANGVTKLKRELVTIDTGGATGELHFKAPSIGPAANLVYYIYYGNAAAAETNDTDTWDSFFETVQHMKDVTTSTISGSTVNSKTGTKLAANQPIEATGKVGEAQDFDGTDDHIDLGAGFNLSKVTFESVQKADLLHDGYIFERRIVNDQNRSHMLVIADGRIIWGHVVATVFENLLGPATHTPGTPFYLAGVREVGNAITYFNGVSDATLSGSQTWADFSATLNRIGRNVTVQPFNGTISEIRISNVIRASDWISTTHETLMNPSTFFSVGDEEAFVSDDITITEVAALEVEAELQPDVFENITVTDDVTMELLVGVNVSENVTVTEAVTAFLPELTADVFDSVTVTEVETVLLPELNVEVTESFVVSISETATLLEPQPDVGVVTSDVIVADPEVEMSLDALFVSVDDDVVITEDFDAIKAVQIGVLRSAQNSIPRKIAVHSGFTATLVDSLTVDSIVDSGGLKGLAFKAGDVYIATTAPSDKFMRLTGLSLTIADSFVSPSTEPHGIEFDSNGNLLSVDDVVDKVFKHSGFTSTISDSFAYPSPMVALVGISEVGGNVVLSEGIFNVVKKMSGFSSTVIDSFSVSGSPLSHDFDEEGNLVTGTQAGYKKFNGFSSTVTDSFPQSSLSPQGTDIAISEVEVRELVVSDSVAIQENTAGTEITTNPEIQPVETITVADVLVVMEIAPREVAPNKACFLLLRGEKQAGDPIVDSGFQDIPITVVGGADAPEVSTAQSKFGSASIFLNGLAGGVGGEDRFVRIAESDVKAKLDVFGAEIGGGKDFTIECWFFMNTVPSGSQEYALFAMGNNEGNTINTVQWTVRRSGSVLRLFLNVNGSAGSQVARTDADIIDTVGVGNAQAGIWVHYELSRAAGSFYRQFVNGVLIGSRGDAGDPSEALGINIGAEAAILAALHTVDGYIDEYCITLGLAKHTANFTPPAVPNPEGTLNEAVDIVEDVAASVFTFETFIVETVTVTEFAEVSVPIDVIVIDFVTVVEDAPVEKEAPTPSVSDDVTVTEFIIVGLADAIQQFEAITVVEQATAFIPILVPSVADTITIEESVTIFDIIVELGPVFETITATEVVTAQLDALFASTSDLVAVTEVTTQFLDVLFFSVFEPFQFLVTEAVSVVDLVVEVGVTEDSTLVDFLVDMLIDALFLSEIETVTVTEVRTLDVLFEVSVSETITVVESATDGVTPIPVSVLDDDIVTIAEFINLLDIIVEMSGADNVAVTEVVTVDVPFLFLSASDTVTVVENAVPSLDVLNIDVVDPDILPTIDVLETVVAAIVLALIVSDTIAVAEFATVVDIVIELGPVSDAVVIAESISVIDLIVEVGPVVDNITVTEQATVFDIIVELGPVFETVTITEFANILDIIVELSAFDVVGINEVFAPDMPINFEVAEQKGIAIITVSGF